MTRKDKRIIARKRRKLKRRQRRKLKKGEGSEPMLGATNIRYEMGERVRAIGCGGIGAIHKLVKRIGLDRAIDEAVQLLKIHNPYHESDHVLNIAYNIVTGGTCLEDIERLREDPVYMDALGTRRIPDQTTAGDFTRRFGDEGSVLRLQEAINEKRRVIWGRQKRKFRREAVVDVDGTLTETQGECKEKIDISYKGTWGYAPLVVSLENTQEVLYLVNRSGNVKSSHDAGRWVDKTLVLLEGVFEKILLRGDTDFSMTKRLDGWNARGHEFILGYKAYETLIEKAEGLEERLWRPLTRPERYEAESERARPENVKEAVVRQRGYKNIHLESEEVSEFEYRPGACEQPYRMVVVRKNLSVEKGEAWLFDDIRYFFYITNDWQSPKEEVVLVANGRCNQENLISQLKTGVNAFGAPTTGFFSNWAYMVIASLAWTLKTWFAMMIPDSREREKTLRMEFKRFATYFINIPCQIIRTGRRLIYRIVAYNPKLSVFLRTYETITQLKFT